MPSPDRAPSVHAAFRESRHPAHRSAVRESVARHVHCAWSGKRERAHTAALVLTDLAVSQELGKDYTEQTAWRFTRGEGRPGPSLRFGRKKACLQGLNTQCEQAPRLRTRGPA